MVHTILIVDSEPAQRDLLTYSLQNRLGYRTLSASSASEATQYFFTDPNHRPDLILFDWSTGGGTNPETNLKTLSLHAPLVVLVKYGDYEAAVAALNAGAQDFLTKPVAMERISTSFRNLILLRDAHREVERLRRERMQEAGALHTAGGGLANTGGMQAAPVFPLTGEDGNIRRMEDIEAEAIRFAMQYYHGRMTEVARRLGIGRSTLYRKLSGFGGRQEEAVA